MMPRRLLPVTLVAAALVALSGCTGETDPAPAPTMPAPSPTETIEPSPEPTAAPIDQLDLRAESIVALAGGEVVTEVDARDADAAVALLTELFGEPTTQQVEDGECVRRGIVYEWGDELLITDNDADPVGDFTLRVLSSQFESVDGQTIEVTAAGTVRVGDDVTALIDSTDPAEVEGFESSAIVLIERGWSDEDVAAGVAAFTDDGVVLNFGVPIPVNSGLGC